MRISGRVAGWLGPLGVAALAFVLRVWEVGRPNRLMFDETYYAKHAWSLLRDGYVRDFVDGADELIIAGRTTGLLEDTPTQIAHPEAGKWLIAVGEQLFGLDAFGWRISAVVVGALTVLVLARLVRRLTGSTWLGCLAGLLLTFDGLHFVMSRIALLDGFLTFWLVSAVACLAVDRDHLVERLERSADRLPVRPWQLLAGVCFGMAIGTKWSGLFVLAAFGLLVVGWEVLARRRTWSTGGLTAPPPWIRTTLVVGAPAFVSLVGIAFLVYLATWTGWLVHHEVYAERFDLGDGGPLSQLWRFHGLTLDFHTGEFLAGQDHPYQSAAWGWPVLDRPVAVDAVNDLPAATCGAPADSSCLRVVTLLGNPLVWWPGAAALLVALVLWVRSRDWRLGLALTGAAATWVPWLPLVRLDDRPIFSFYSVAMLPFTIIAVCVLLHLAWERSGPRARRALAGAVVAWVVAVVVSFAWFHPVLTGALQSYDAWRSRMWFSRWI
ncbi:dolichyl-phosphate-mannose-protein mannosyltransferase [Aeromicrobium marinum DSM 15272]|uniref:Polyprenol-phosphate-mannose--protein mannosyltransferase n=1 Tax=Aeromicrobium marinum DSM 15272 TaxID=585531 RepID=E2SDM4_9ACTN|nr:phospholipid carrier-dependent glycosyltransferase [Aeromicrobium marinum]EFQ82601.1 dolichyl-phosphate-mannose-protein mannosyltransferase [Aeromicrobium marinum DSM 15272]